MDVQLVPANEGHRDFLARVSRDAALRYAGLLPGAFEEQAARFLTRPLPDWYRLHIVEANGVHVGFVGLAEFENARLCIVAFYLLNAFQRRGLGHATWSRILADWRPFEAFLVAHRDAHWALAFYRQLGFAELDKETAEKAYVTGRLARYLRDDCVWLRWQEEEPPRLSR
jgi:N-acetylglutamate synthase-like GNAT family acetyltransferase